MGQLVFIGFGNGGGGSGGADPLLTPLDLYVASTGNDANPGTALLPVLTMAGAWSKVRDVGGQLTYQIGAPVRVHVAQFPAGTLQWSPVPGYQAINESGEVIVYGDGALQGVEDGFTPITTGAAGASTNVSVGFVAAPDAFLGRTIEFTNGPAAGQRRLVRNNTATEIIPVAAFTAAPLLGDTFRILAPAASIDLTAGSTDIQTSADIPVTLINLDSDAAGGGFALRALGVNILKLYGCTFSNTAHLSLFDTNAYAGMALGQVTENIRLSNLWTALGGVQDWIGWGIASPSDSIAAGFDPFQTLTGYMVSFGAFIAGFSDAAEGHVCLFGGCVQGGLQMANSRADFRTQTPSPAVPTLLRSSGGTLALYVASSTVSVLGGDAALTLEGDNLIQADMSDVEWLGVCTLTAADLIWLQKGGTSRIKLPEDEDLTFTSPTGFFLFDGAEMSVIGDGTSSVNGSIEQIAVLLAQECSFRVSHSDSRIPFPPAININGTAAGIAFAAANNSCIVLGANPTITGAFESAFLIQNQSDLFCNDTTVNLPDGIALICVNESKATFNRLVVDAISGYVAAFQSEVTVATNVQINTIGGPIGINVFGGRFGCIASSGLSANTNPGSAAFIIQEGSTVALSGDVSCNVETFLLSGNSSLAIADFGTLSSATATCIKADTGSNVWFFDTDGSSINAALDGIDCTGGGRAFFSDGTTPPTFTVGGNELVVGPGILEQSPFALALPNPGDAFSNAGVSSTISRKL